MNIISVREHPEYVHKAISYFQRSWPGVRPEIYEDAITHSIQARHDLPQWYLLEKEGEFIGCAGLITNDFISRGDLYPWLCALFIEDKNRGNAYGLTLIEKAKQDAKIIGFEYLYLCTELVGYYEKYDFSYIGLGHHPWGGASRIYELKL